MDTCNQRSLAYNQKREKPTINYRLYVRIENFIYFPNIMDNIAQLNIQIKLLNHKLKEQTTSTDIPKTHKMILMQKPCLQYIIAIKFGQPIICQQFWRVLNFNKFPLILSNLYTFRMRCQKSSQQLYQSLTAILYDLALVVNQFAKLMEHQLHTLIRKSI